jgi:hypothetical protein
MREVRLRPELRGAIIFVENEIRNVKPKRCACIAAKRPAKPAEARSRASCTSASL